MRQEKPIITYVKNGQEITQTVTRMNIKSIEKTIFQKGTFNEIYMNLNSDIEYLYLKNITFYDEKLTPFSSETIKFCLNNDQILILENCTFNGRGIYFYQGNIQIIHPKFKNGTYLIESFFGNIVDIILNDNISWNTILYFEVDTKHFSLDAGCSINIKKLEIEAKNIQIANLENIEKLSLNAEEKIIFNRFNYVTLSGNSDCYIEAKKIDLGDVIIDNPTSTKSTIVINSPYIIGEKFLLMSIGNIKINNNIYCPSKNRKHIMLGKPDFDEITSRIEVNRKLISCLKTINNEVVKRYEERVTQAKTKVLKRLNNQPIGTEKFHQQKET